jgi:hypothetical protein
VSSVFLFIGGGPRVFTAVTVALLADSVPDKQEYLPPDFNPLILIET